MIPFVAIVSLRNQDSRTFRLWIPLFLIWLLLLPFRIIGIAVDGVLEVIRGIIMLPGRILRGPRRA